MRFKSFFFHYLPLRLPLSPKGKFWTTITCILLFVFTTPFVVKSLDSNEVVYDSSITELNNKIMYQPEFVDLYVAVTEVDTSTQFASGKILIQPPERFAYLGSNSITTKVPMSISFDVAKIEGANIEDASIYVEEGSDLGFLDFQLDLTNDAFTDHHQDTYFPFDNYSSQFWVNVQFLVSGQSTDTTKDDAWESLPVRIIPYSTAIADIKVTYSYVSRLVGMPQSELESLNDKQLENLMEGTASLQLIFERPLLTKFIVGFLCLVFLSGGLSMLFLYRAILFEYRQPSIAALAWAASTTFTMIQSRRLIPSDPRAGVLIDVWVFYPSLALCFIFSILMLRKWLKATSSSDRDL